MKTHINRISMLNKHRSIHLIIVLLASLLFSCSEGSALPKIELVMGEGMTIEATNANGMIVIEARTRLKRIYSWDDNNIEVRMWPRKERWNGSNGAYSPGGGNDIHAVVEEGQQHFCSENEALEWLTWQRHRKYYVYTSDGLVIGWRMTKDPNSRMIALSVKVWQFYINGKKPRNLSGSQNALVKINFKNGTSSNLPLIGKFNPSQPKNINGRWYSGKAIDYMQEKKRDYSDIEKVITHGEIKQDGAYLVYYGLGDKFDPFEDVTWVKLDKKGRVVLFN